MKKFALALALVLLSATADAAPRQMSATGVSQISTPAGCPARLFCACALARYWGIWKRELNAVSQWGKHFARADGPAVGRAAVRNDQHHILGIVGGGPGAWQVVDFNSGGHRSHAYTAASFPGYHFLEVRGGGGFNFGGVANNEMGLANGGS